MISVLTEDFAKNDIWFPLYKDLYIIANTPITHILLFTKLYCIGAFFSGFPDKVSHILQFITEVHSFYRQQRSLMKPIVLHCR